ncbi:hypothetical protein ANN_11445 [Periplaneta americana]|uniref:C2H2-type domain-containing protein n=1 Tax=Periplaneta americana TaxID=6978 RepID=A0ABQ8T6E2_PERAM|nr:hypothetical protein ANN_11445 [Periplaneta americana]
MLHVVKQGISFHNTTLYPLSHTGFQFRCRIESSQFKFHLLVANPHVSQMCDSGIMSNTLCAEVHSLRVTKWSGSDGMSAVLNHYVIIYAYHIFVMYRKRSRAENENCRPLSTFLPHKTLTPLVLRYVAMKPQIKPKSKARSATVPKGSVLMSSRNHQKEKMNTLQQHMKVHTGKDFKCQHQGCIFACRSQAELRNHQQVHSYHRPYHCDTCTYSAKTKAQLLSFIILSSSTLSNTASFLTLSVHFTRSILLHIHISNASIRFSS